jgi:hypothetical protein
MRESYVVLHSEVKETLSLELRDGTLACGESGTQVVSF